MATSTPRWSDRTSSRGENEWTITRSWDVVNVVPNDEDDAYGATPESGPAIPEAGDPDSVHTNMYAKTPRISKWNGPTACIVQCEFSTRPPSGEQGGGDPLLQPTTVWTDYSVMYVPREYDINNNAIVSASKQPFDNNGPVREVSVIELMCERNEPFYDLNGYSPYVGGVNIGTISLGAIQIPERKMLMRIPRLAGVYPLAVSAFVRVTYQFSICLELDEPWEFEAANVGTIGYYSDSGTKAGPFVDSNGVPLGVPVRLTSTGTPMDSTIKVGKWNNGTRIYEAQAAIASGWSAGTGVTVLNKTDINAIRYRQRPGVNFLELNL